jgi:hypothetical protein
VKINRNLKIVYTITEEEQQGAQDTISSSLFRQQWTGEITPIVLTFHLLFVLAVRFQLVFEYI